MSGVWMNPGMTVLSPNVRCMSAGAAERTPLPDRPGRPDLRGLVEVRRSSRRLRTVSAYREGGRTIVLIPGRFSAAEERHWVEAMLDKLAQSDRRRRPSDEELARRARLLADRFLPAAPPPVSIRWVTNQNSRWGSCTPAEGTIRISTKLRGMPAWVIDYVVLHELAHLLQPGHGRPFWALLEAYPRLERARGYLEGVAAAKGLDLDDDESDVDEVGASEDDVDRDDGPSVLRRAGTA